jgi:catechol 2,3-dioxygenase
MILPTNILICEFVLKDPGWLSVYSNGIKIGPPLLLVKDFDKVLNFYERYLDLQSVRQYPDHHRIPKCELYFRHDSSSSNKSPLILLQHDPDARSASPYSAGLFHFAILLPSRKDLASTYLALRELGVRFDGFADHLVSESLYLRDPENNGIEIYYDRPKEEWPRDSEGNLMMDTLPLDLQLLLSELNKDELRNAIHFPTGGRIGHIHLRVTNLERSIRFYSEKLGLDLTVDWRSIGAAFLSKGGYHHHIGINTWYSLDGEVHDDDVSGLRSFGITTSNMSYFNLIKSNVLNNSPSRKQRNHLTESNQFTVTDPNGIQIVIRIDELMQPIP